MPFFNSTRTLSTFVLAFCALLFGSASWAADQVMPSLFGVRMDDSLFSTSQLPKRARVVNFFWVGCEPCRKEIPLLARKEKQYPNVDFVLVHLEPNSKGEDYPLSEIRAYINSLPAAPANTIRVTKRMKEELGIQAYPMTALVAADGKIDKLLTGLTPEVQQTLETWLKRQ